MNVKGIGKGRGRRSKVPIEEVIRLYNSGLSADAIGRQFGLINGHCVRWRLRKAGITIRDSARSRQFKVGPANHRWRGGRIRLKDGYIRVYVGPRGDGIVATQYIHEHRKVMQDQLGRPLRNNEFVHHLNGIRDDNRLENLVVVTADTHEQRTFTKALQTEIKRQQAVIEKLRSLTKSAG